MQIGHWICQIVYTFATTVKSNHVFTHRNISNLRVTVIQILIMLLHIFQHVNLYMGSNQLCGCMLLYNCLLLFSKEATSYLHSVHVIVSIMYFS